MSSPEEISSRSPTAKSVKRTKHNFRASVSSPNFSNTLLNTPPPPPPPPPPPSLFQSIPPPPAVDVVDTWNNVIDHDYFNSFPPGYRFNPSDKELILSYLKPKVDNQTLPKHRIVEANLYQHNPEDLADEYKDCGEGEWYFFTPRDRKYKNGFRPKRAAGNGYWKATGGDKKVKSQDKIIGYRNSLVFYVGKAPKGDKTNWIMHEYRVNSPPTPANKRTPNDMRLDDWVLCRIYKKTDRNKSKRTSDKNNMKTSDKKDVEVSSITHNDVADTGDDPEVFQFKDDSPTGNFEGKTSFTEPFSSFASDGDAAAAQLYSHSFYSVPFSNFATGIPDPYLLEPDYKPGSPDHYFSSLASIPLVDMPRLATYSSYGLPSNPPPSDIVDCKPTGPVGHLPVHVKQSVTDVKES